MIVSVWLFSSICEWNKVLISCIKFRIEKSLYLKTVFPASILLISRTSLIIPNKCCDEISILSAYSITLALFPASCLINDVIPIIAFIGVRISCDILDRKSVFLFSVCHPKYVSINLRAVLHPYYLPNIVLRQQSFFPHPAALQDGHSFLPSGC